MFGDIANDMEKEQVDLDFYNNLINKAHMRPWIAKVFLVAVSTGGHKRFNQSFSWGAGNLMK